MENNISITILLSQEELDALAVLAKQQRRDVQGQAAMMIHHGLEEYGLIAWQPDWKLLVDRQPTSQIPTIPSLETR